MNIEEIALQITIKAIEVGAVRFAAGKFKSDEVSKVAFESANEFNADEIVKLYTKIYKAVKAQRAATD